MEVLFLELAESPAVFGGCPKWKSLFSLKRSFRSVREVRESNGFGGFLLV